MAKIVSAEKGSTLFKSKADKNFNRMNTFQHFEDYFFCTAQKELDKRGRFLRELNRKFDIKRAKVFMRSRSMDMQR